MWDIMNSSSVNAPPRKKSVSLRRQPEDIECFHRYSAFVDGWEYVQETGARARKVPSLDGWKLGLSATQHLSAELVRPNGLSFLCREKVNQDHVENFHAQISAYHSHNHHPMLDAYVTAIRCLASAFSSSELLDRTISAGANCCPDSESTATDPEIPPTSIAKPSPDPVLVDSPEDIQDVPPEVDEHPVFA